MRNFNRLPVITAIIMLFGLLPACKRVYLKSLPAIPARQDNNVHVEAHLLNNKETKDYLGFSFGNKSSLCAWHLIAYNPTSMDFSITAESWSIKPSTVNELSPYIRARYYPYIPVIGTIGVITGLGLTVTSLFYFSTAMLFARYIASNTLVYYSLASGAGALGSFVGTPFLAYHIMNKKISMHEDALTSQLFPIDGVIPGKTNLQGIVILPQETLIEPWQLQLFDQNNKAQIFIFNNQNIYA